MTELSISDVYLFSPHDGSADDDDSDDTVDVKYEPTGAYQKLREGISINVLKPVIVSVDDLSWRSPSIS